MANTHIVTKTTVVQLENGAYGVKFEFDDGYADFAEVGSKETADFYATRADWGSNSVSRINPMFKIAGVSSPSV